MGLCQSLGILIYGLKAWAAHDALMITSVVHVHRGALNLPAVVRCYLRQDLLHLGAFPAEMWQQTCDWCVQQAFYFLPTSRDFGRHMPANGVFP